MTSEQKDKTEAWVDEKEAAYPYAYDREGKLSATLKVTGIPAAFLVNPKGMVVWKGHPSSLNKSIIKEHIKGASRNAPGLDGLTSAWPKSAASVKKLLAKNKIGKALVAAKKLAEKDQACATVVETLAGLAKDEVDAVIGLKETGDILGALDAAKLAKKALAGSEQAKTVEALVKEIKADKNSSQVWKAQLKLAKLKSKFDKIRKRKDAQALIKKLETFIAKNAGNFAGKSAAIIKDDLSKSMERMRR